MQLTKWDKRENPGLVWKWAVTKHFGSIWTTENWKKCYTTGNNWGQISCWGWNPPLLDLGECAAGSLQTSCCRAPHSLSGQTPASSGILSVWKVHEGAGRHFYELRFSWFEKEPLNSSISSWIKSKSSAVFWRSITLAVVTLYGTDARFSLLKAQFTIHIASIWIHVWCDITSLSWKENPL